MLGAYVLAGELKQNRSDHNTAFERYEARLKGLVTAKQESAATFGGWFAPRTRLGVFARDQVTRLMQFPFVAGALLGSLLKDDIALPEFDD